jgi:acyl dehydratase
MSHHGTEDLIEKGVRKYREKWEGAILSPPVGTHVVTNDTIRHYANGLGDANPLWHSEDRCRNSIYGGSIAPPSFLNAVSEGQAIVGLPGLIATYVGAEWEWFKIIRTHDRFSVTNQLLPLIDKTGGNGPRQYLQSGILRYVAQSGAVTGQCTWRMMRTEIKLGGKGSEKREDKVRETIKIHAYSAADLEKIYRDIDSETFRGTSPRYVEDVLEGEEIPLVVKGPLSLSDMVAWAGGISWHRMALAHGPKLKFLRDHSGLSYTDPQTGIPEPIANSHFEPDAAKILMGSPLPLDLGFQRIAWLSHPITNWMGDHGFLKQLNVRLKGFVRFGDTNWCRGKVVRTWHEGVKAMVELEVSSENQRGETTAQGSAVIVLPSRKAGADIKMRGENPGRRSE